MRIWSLSSSPPVCARILLSALMVVVIGAVTGCPHSKRCAAGSIWVPERVLEIPGLGAQVVVRVAQEQGPITVSAPDGLMLAEGQDISLTLLMTDEGPTAVSISGLLVLGFTPFIRADGTIEPLVVRYQGDLLELQHAWKLLMEADERFGIEPLSSVSAGVGP